MGTTPEEEAAITSVCCSYEDIYPKLRVVVYPFTEEERSGLVENTNIFLNFIVKFLVAFEKRIVKNGGKYFTGKFSLADIWVTCYFKQSFWNNEDRIKNWVPVIEKNAPILLKMIESVSSNELKCFFDGGAFVANSIV